MLKPTRRIKRRYILVETELSEKEVMDYLFEHFGILNFGKLNAKLIEEGGKKILRVNREFYYDVLGVLSLTNRIKTIVSSGTIKGIFRKIKDKEV